MMVMKSTPVFARTFSASGCNRAEGFSERNASATSGDCATAMATDVDSSRAESSVAREASRQARATPAPTSTATITSNRTSSWRATPHGLRGRFAWSGIVASPFPVGERNEHNRDRHHRHPDSSADAYPTIQEAVMAKEPTAAEAPPRRDRVHYLYLAVVGAVVLGIVVGFAFPDFSSEHLKPLGEGFVKLIKMMISPIIFCTIVLGIGSVAKAAKVGKVGALALTYFLIMSTVALAIGLVVGNVLHPGEGMRLDPDAVAKAQQSAQGGESTEEFLLGIIPETLVSALTSGSVLQTLLIALLAGFALQRLGPAGAPILRGIEHVQRLVFRILAMIMWAAPVGAFGAIAAVVGDTGRAALKSLAVIMLGFDATCIVFVFVVLGAVLWFVARINLWQLLRYLAREFLLILSTSSSESALPRLIAKMEHMGVS